MRNFLKSSTVEMPDGEPLVIRELSAGGRRALMEATREHKGDPFMLYATTAKHGSPELFGETVEDILAAYPPDLLATVAGEILKLSGIAADSEAQAEKN